MKVLSIDSGNIQSAYIIFDTELKKVIKKNILPNEDFIKEIKSMKKWISDDNSELNKIGIDIFSGSYVNEFDSVAIEKIVSMGMSVGNSTFETIFQNGRLYEMFINEFNIIPNLYSRLDIKVHLCFTTRAKDTNVRMALINRFGETSTKKTPTDVYNELTDKIYFGSHFWSCLAVCIYHIEEHHHNPIFIDEWGSYKEIK